MQYIHRKSSTVCQRESSAGSNPHAGSIGSHSIVHREIQYIVRLMTSIGLFNGVQLTLLRASIPPTWVGSPRKLETFDLDARYRQQFFRLCEILFVVNAFAGELVRSATAEQTFSDPIQKGCV